MEKCLTLARKSFDALPSGGHIMLHEALLRDTLDGPLTGSNTHTHTHTHTQSVTLTD